MESKTKQKSQFSLFLLIALVILILDQISKYIVRHSMQLGSSIQIFPFFQFHHLYNTGAGFSILQGNNFLLIWLGIIVLGIILYFSGTYKKREVLWVGIVLGGILGNLFDRIIFGGVTDFIAISIWPVFNIADSAISIGIIAYIIENFIIKNFKK